MSESPDPATAALPGQAPDRPDRGSPLPTRLAPDDAALVAALEPVLGHHFADPALLVRAFAHRSYVYEAARPGQESNERLEFLGDAVLGLIAADLLFARAPASNEGELTTLRAALIRASTLAAFARRLELGRYLRLGRGHVPARLRDRIWASAFEAMLGALYLDGGLSAARRFIEPLLLEEAEHVLASGELKDAKSQLQDRAQSQLGLTPTYRVVAAEGPAHEPIFAVEVLLGERVLARGVGRSKRQAEQAAAEQALQDPGWLPEMPPG